MQARSIALHGVEHLEAERGIEEWTNHDRYRIDDPLEVLGSIDH